MAYACFILTGSDKHMTRGGVINSPYIYLFYNNILRSDNHDNGKPLYTYIEASCDSNEAF